ncbi:putative membrane protein [Spathaspora sp. JA1]|nr:putative membrane protein [Spathaspora sp. JA1]
MRLITLLYLFASISSAIAMDHAHEHTNSSPSKEIATNPTNKTSLIPIPHVAHHMHGVPILEMDLLPEERLFWENYNTTTYFNVATKHRAALYLHIGFALISVIFIYPIALIFNNLNMHKSYMTTLFVHSGVIVFSLLNYSIFINSIPELYPGNAYSKMMVILFVTTILQVIFALIRSIDPNTTSGTQYHTLHSDDESRNSLTHDGEEEEESSSRMEKPVVITGDNILGKIMRLRIWVAQTRFHKVAVIGFNFLNWGHFFYFLITVPTGVATFLVYGKGNTVFNLLAHFIKGGVFFAYGILTLARYSGGFLNKGWAWNHKFISTANRSRWFSFQNKGLCTMEMLESSLILFYGSTNIFLEHLGNAGGEWSAKDLQHASIAFIYIGCGLCGVICENKLSDWRYEQAKENLTKSDPTNDFSSIVKASPGYSPNPFPILTIYWTGVLMSAHEQASELSTTIHTQWGNLFVLGCAFRFLTYLLMLLSSKLPHDLTRAGRPITELMVAFCLLCGGAIFIESCDPIILSFEYYGLTAGFTLNVSLGFITLFMAWEMSLFAFKDWLKNKYIKEEQNV